MKSKNRIRLPAVVLVLLLSAAGCARPIPPETPPSDTAGTAADTAAYAPPNDRSAAYESVIEALEEKLLREKTERYLSDYAYAETVAALRLQLDSLREDAQAVSAGTGTLPQQSAAGTEEPTRTAEPDTQAASASFRYGIVGGEAVIYAFTGGGPDLVIPADVGGYPVAVIADDAVRGAAITSVTLPDTVREIGWFAFADCPRLKTVILPASLSSVGYGAFSGCPSVTVVCAPDTYADIWAKSCGMTVCPAP